MPRIENPLKERLEIERLRKDKARQAIITNENEVMMEENENLAEQITESKDKKEKAGYEEELKAISRADKEYGFIAQAADGSFEMAGLSNGNFGLASRQSCTLVRLWQAGSAPPAATKKTLLVASGKTVRSQSGISDGLFRIGEAIGIVAIPLLIFGAAIILQGYRGGKQSNPPFQTPH